MPLFYIFLFTIYGYPNLLTVHILQVLKFLKLCLEITIYYYSKIARLVLKVVPGTWYRVTIIREL